MSENGPRTVVLKGIGVSPGIATGKAYVLDDAIAHVPYYELRDEAHVWEEIGRFEKALRNSKRQLSAIKKKLSDREGVEPLFVIDVHIMMLKDKKLIYNTINNIKEKKINAEWAIKLTMDRYREIFDKIEDEYLKARFSDVEYVGQRILRNLIGKDQIRISDIGEIAVIIARDLSPADTVQMKIENILGFARHVGKSTASAQVIGTPGWSGSPARCGPTTR